MHIVVLCGIALIRQKKCMSILTQPEGFITGMAAKMFTVAQRLRGPGGERRSKGAGGGGPAALSGRRRILLSAAKCGIFSAEYELT